LLDPADESNTVCEMPGSSIWYNKPEYTGLPDNFHFGLNLEAYCGIKKKPYS